MKLEVKRWKTEREKGNTVIYDDQIKETANKKDNIGSNGINCSRFFKWEEIKNLKIYETDLLFYWQNNWKVK